MIRNGLPDPDSDADRHQNVIISWSVGHTPALRKISSKSVGNSIIHWIRISDFGLLDSDGDPDRHQNNWIHWSLGHALPLQEISSKYVHNFFSYATDRQTDKQTDRSKNITSFGGTKDLSTYYSAAYTSRLKTSCSALQSGKWQLIGVSLWYCGTLRGHSLPAIANNNWSRDADLPPPQSATLGLQSYSPCKLLREWFVCSLQGLWSFISTVCCCMSINNWYVIKFYCALEWSPAVVDG